MVFLLFTEESELLGAFSTYEKAEQEIVRSFEDEGKEFYSLKEWKEFFIIKKIPIDKLTVL